MRLVYYRDCQALPRVWIRCVPTHKTPDNISAIANLIPISAGEPQKRTRRQSVAGRSPPKQKAENK